MPIKRSEPSKAMNRLIEAGSLIFIGGTTATDKSKDILGQAREIFDKFDALLAKAGVDKTAITSAAVYMADLSLKSSFSAAWNEWLPDEHLPARSVVGVSQLGQGTLVEITLTAFRG